VLAFVIRRLLVSIPVLLLASFVVFLLVAAAGDPLDELRLRNPPPTEAQLEAYADRLGLDEPLLERYGSWIGDVVLHQDFGTDLQGQAVWPQLSRAVGVTLRLVVAAVVVAVGLAVVVGVLSAVRQYSWFDHSATFLSFLFFSLPVFWLAVLLKEFVAIPFNDWLEGLGFARFLGTVHEETPNLEGGFGDVLHDRLGHLVLPALTLVVVSFAQYSRFTRASMLEALGSDYVRTAEAKGLSRRRVVVRHALRNALVPLTTIVAIDFSVVLGGAVVVETVFQWRGMGTLFTDAVRALDVHVVLAWLLVSATLVVLFNLIADVLYAYLDPRIRL
jgi:peptide/nickel transport system permease protein